MSFCGEVHSDRLEDLWHDLQLDFLCLQRFEIEPDVSFFVRIPADEDPEQHLQQPLRLRGDVPGRAWLIWLLPQLQPAVRLQLHLPEPDQLIAVLLRGQRNAAVKQMPVPNTNWINELIHLLDYLCCSAIYLSVSVHLCLSKLSTVR